MRNKRSYSLSMCMVAAVFAGAVGCDPGGDDLGATEDATHRRRINELWVTAQATGLVKIFNFEGNNAEAISVGATAQPHMVDLSPSGRYAFVANMGDGSMNVVRTRDRQIVTTFSFGTLSTHQAKPSPDGSVVLIAQIQTGRLIKLAANEGSETWTVAGELAVPAIPRAPICTVFTRDSTRAFVSLAASAVVEVDVATMTVIRTHAVGNVQCGLSMASTGDTVYVSDNFPGGTTPGGRLWTIDVATGSLADTGAAFNAADLHGSAVNNSETKAFVTGRADDTFRTLDFASNTVSTLSLDLTAGFSDAPEQIVVLGRKKFVTLGNAGKVVRVEDGAIADIIDVAPAAFGAGFFGRAIHGIAIRKDSRIINIGDASRFDDDSDSDSDGDSD